MPQRQPQDTAEGEEPMAVDSGRAGLENSSFHPNAGTSQYGLRHRDDTATTTPSDEETGRGTEEEEGLNELSWVCRRGPQIVRGFARLPSLDWVAFSKGKGRHTGEWQGGRETEKKGSIIDQEGWRREGNSTEWTLYSEKAEEICN